MKIAAIILSVCLLITIGLTGCTTKPIESQFTVQGEQIYRVNIYLNKGQTITGSWKSDKSLYQWWVNPGGTAFPLGDVGSDVTGVFQPDPLTQTDPKPSYFINGQYAPDSMLANFGGNINIHASLPLGQSGYYTICFYSFDYKNAQDIATILLHYSIK